MNELYNFKIAFLDVGRSYARKYIISAIAVGCESVRV